ncbi:MAG: hypothetical protein QG566_264 [Patescibacteria group bacterium]|jgi:hypothetical protein|nr:hypothetical protein [Patescibacteria group bacterium]
MINEQLVNYIKTVEAQGFTESAVRDVLAKAGWQSNEVEEAYSHMKLLKGMPVPAGTAQINIPQQTVSINVAKSTVASSHTINQNHSVEYNSPYSIGLATVLCAAIFILLNKVIDDSAIFTNSINAKLIFDVMLIVPFIVVAFILHESFRDHKKKFLIMSQPYFLVSGFLLVRLLWDTSNYILNANAAYGVYVVLILIIIVLTGSILFIQKYMKS